jgi:CRISPR-associated endonuclease/helicase Cas3
MRVEDFTVFFEALHGYPPFPWQERLMRDLCEVGVWPDVLALPTGSGKTSVLDLAVFHLAMQATLPARERTAPRRIFFVIDRRIVVDEAFAHASSIGQRLNNAESGILADVAHALKSLAGDANSPPLHVAVMRGGLYRDNHWARSPLQPTIIVSTVDQVGSRILFRGYGLGRGVTRPIHAALVGVDSLIILDEAHLSHPFVQTLESVRSLQHREREWLGLRLAWTRMTATPGTDTSVFREDAQDRRHPVLGRRLSVQKLARLDLVATTNVTKAMRTAERTSVVRTNRSNIASRCVELARALTAEAGASVTGIIVNEVATAREVFAGLQKAVNEGAAGEVVLLIGRSRSWDRHVLLHEHGLWERIRNGRDRPAGMGAPLYVVATQCVEVGADIDFDALVTECAALDALRQRFGRLNRGAHHGVAHAWVVGASHQVAGSAEPHFIYGKALAKTWQWLREKTAAHRQGLNREGAVDFATNHLQALLPVGEEMTALLTPRAQAPMLLPAHLEMLSHTFPPLATAPEPALYLHGPQTTPPDVNIVWRADLDPVRPKTWAQTVSMLPPSTAECLSVPAYAVTAWLSELPAEVQDIEGAGIEGDERVDAGNRIVLRWDGPDASTLANPSEVRPGDTIIVPSRYGGADRYGWNPTCMDMVEDLAEPAALAQRGRLHLRLHPEVWRLRRDSLERAGIDPDVWVEELRELITDHDTGDINITEAHRWLLSMLPDDSQILPAWLTALRQHLGQVREWYAPAFYPDEVAVPAAFVSTFKRRLSPLGLGSGTSEFADEDDSSSEGAAQKLGVHLELVSSLARSYAVALGLSSDLVEAIALAGNWHDLGKADPRFQSLLGAAGQITSNTVNDSATLLAKSGDQGVNPADVPGWASGFRHESMSVALAASAPIWPADVTVRDLVLHLIASHHGRARPFLPVVEDAARGEVSVEHQGNRFTVALPHLLEKASSGVADRFWLLSRQFGHYGLAWLETLLRLADQAVSRKNDGKEFP